MEGYYFLIPVSVGMGLVAVGAFFWSLRTHQYEDMKGAAVRVLLNEEDKHGYAIKDSSDTATKPEVPE